MKDEEKDKEALIKELNKLRRRVIQAKVSEIRYNRARKLLKKSREKYRAAFKYAKDPMVWIDTGDGTISNCNKAAEVFFGKTRDELVGYNQLTLRPPELAAYYTAVFEIQTDEHYDFAYENEGENGFSYQGEVIAKSGKIIPVRVSASVASVENKRIIQEIFHDITKYDDAEKQRSFTEHLTDSIPYLIFCKDTEGIYRWCNTAFSELAGIHKYQIVGKTDYEIFPKKVGEAFRKKDEEVFSTGKPKSEEEWAVYPDGRSVLLDTLRILHRGNDDRVLGLIGISRDITESRKMMEAIKKADITNRKHVMEAFKKATKNLMVAQQQLNLKNSRLNETLEKVEEANEKIMDSIRYAKVIQTALLPNLDGSNIYLPNSFVIWIPKDVVGGDIFFKDAFDELDSCGFVLAVIDCTGHGVPGAFMTMIASSALRRIIKDQGCYNPAEILKELNFIVKTSLQQDKKTTLSNDGLDAAICFVSERKNDKDSLLLTFAGARLPLYYVHNGEVNIIKGDRESIGYKKSDPDFDFTNHPLKVEPGMSFYMSTDGFVDQLGGKKNRRFGTTRFKHLLHSSYMKSFEEQREMFLSTFEDYRGENERQDDVTVVGFSFKRGEGQG